MIESLIRFLAACRSLFTLGNPKTAKGEAAGWLTAILHFAPHNLADGLHNVCPWATPGCVAACLYTAGHGGILKVGENFNSIMLARIARTRLFLTDRPAFLAGVRHEIRKHIARAERNGLRPCVRLNGTSDIAYETIDPALFAEFPSVKFYDYTKGISRAMRSLTDPAWPTNYHLTYSQAETAESREHAAQFVTSGGTACVVAHIRKGAPIPPTYRGMPTIDGDLTDLRFTDPAGHYVIVRAKGKAKRDCTGFVVPTAEFAV